MAARLNKGTLSKENGTLENCLNLSDSNNANLPRAKRDGDRLSALTHCDFPLLLFVRNLSSVTISRFLSEEPEKNSAEMHRSG